MSETADAMDILAAVYPAPSDLAVAKELDHLDAYCRRFIELSPFVVLATAGNGFCDASPRGDKPGFVVILDDRTLVIPDRPGNNRIDSHRNLAERPEVGLLFLIPGYEETLRVRGRATLSVDEGLLTRTAVYGRCPRSVLLVSVQSAFYHCGKCMRRSELWRPETWPPRTALPSLGRILAAQIEGSSAEALDARINESYTTRLY